MRASNLVCCTRCSWAIAILLDLATPTAAQWLNYPTPGMPRLSNGKTQANRR